ncbi:MAG: peptide chain release factor 2 [Alphaproteobacteria bacterium]|nr:peptide chain release factor 2 [Alphaproteobacteria bacterium]
MRAEILALVDEIQQSLALLRRHLDLDAAKLRLEELNALAEDPKLWEEPERAQKVMRERTRLDDGIGSYLQLESSLKDNVELIELAETEGEADVAAEAEKALAALRDQAAKMELESLLSGEADANDCYLEVHAGAGGTESQDWAEMLLRMYTRWSEQHGYKVEYIEESAGDEAGLKSATIRVSGVNAYGWLKTESGVHRLVRISPYDAASRRHTSFASIGVYPVIDDTIEIEVVDSDLRVDTYRASGAGGQHVNRTDSAVRITHMPTGIVVQCQSDRSQHRNRAQAMTMLKARLYERELQKREEQAQAEHAAKTDIGWGHQIRSYVLHPYKMVKDLRTNVEKGNAEGVLDGDLDPFLEAALAARVAGGSKAEKAG